jgi:hypothetical protein
MTRHLTAVTSLVRLRGPSCAAWVPAKAESPFAGSRGYLLQRDVQHHVRGHYSSFIALTDSCARPNPSLRLRFSLVRRVPAGCRQSLLGDGPSRRYLRNPCIGAWTHTPWCSSSASARFFLEDIGLTLLGRRSAHQIIPTMQLRQGARFRGCSHSLMFRLPYSLDPQIAPTAVTLKW